MSGDCLRRGSAQYGRFSGKRPFKGSAGTKRLGAVIRSPPWSRNGASEITSRVDGACEKPHASELLSRRRGGAGAAGSLDASHLRHELRQLLLCAATSTRCYTVRKCRSLPVCAG